MDVKKIYQNRFSKDIKSRYKLWEILISDFFQKFINKEDVVLDIACGYGEFISQISCRKKYAIDLNPDSKKYLSGDISFYRQSSTKMTSIKTASIDRVFVSNFFEHLNREDIIKTVNEATRVLKKGGSIMILQPNIRFLAADFWRFFDHVTPIDDRALTEVFETKGFVLRKIILKFLPFTTKNSLSTNLFLVRLYLKLPFLWEIFGRQSFMIFKKL